MNRCLPALLVTTMIFLLSAFIAPKNWISFKREDYVISFPGKPTNDSAVAKTELGNVKVHQYSYQSADPENDSTVMYQLIKTTYPAEFPLSTDKDFLKSFFENAIKTTIAKVNGKILFEKEITVNKYPGRDITMAIGDGDIMAKVRMVLAGQKLFGLQTISAAGKENNTDATHFYNLFTVK